MSLAVFEELVGPIHSRPVPIDWDRVESWLTTALPRDFKQLCGRHGALDVGDWFWLRAPVEIEGMPSYDQWLRQSRSVARGLTKELGGSPPALFPDPRSGLLLFGDSRGGDLLAWDPVGADPDAWPVVVMNPGSVFRPGGPPVDPWVRTGLVFGDFLTALVTTGIDGAEGRRLGPYPHRAAPIFGGARQTPWEPPVVAQVSPARRAAMTEGVGMPALVALVPPPGPRPRLDLTGAQSALGVTFPREYVELMDHYGGGCWGSWLRFPDPHSRGGQELLDWLEQNLDAYRMLHDAFPDECPLPLWPAPGGFLPFADSIDGDVLGWLTDGEPDAWPLIWWPRHTEQGPAMRTGLLDMLLGWIRGSAVDPVFPAPEEGEDPFERAVFEAAR